MSDIDTQIESLLVKYTFMFKAMTEKAQAEAIKAIKALLIQGKIKELVNTCLAGMGGLTPEQQSYIETRINELKRELKNQLKKELE